MRFLRAACLLTGLILRPVPAISAAPQPTALITVALAVQDPSGAAIKAELVIVQDLDNHEDEVVRALTDENGEMPPLKLGPGLYRAIATAPYGLWRTRVREFLVNNVPVRLVLRVDPMPTHGYGDVVAIGAKHLHLQVLTPDGRPAVAVSVLARDEEATLHLERWYKTDDSGGATIEVVGDPLVLVVVSAKTLVTREISSKSTRETIRLAEP